MLSNKITILQTLVIRVCDTTLNMFPQLIYKPLVQKHKNHGKASSGLRRFSQNLPVCKTSQYHIRNCKSCRHNRHHTFRRHNSQHKPISNNIPYSGFMIKERERGNTKTPSPCRQNRMFCALNLRQDANLCESTKLKPYILPFGKLDIGIDHLLTDSGYDNHSCIIFPFHCVLNQIDSCTNLLGKLILTEVILQPT